VRLGLCCCGDPGPDPEPGLCGTTSTVPQPWPDRIYTLSISGSFGTTMMKVSMNGQGQDCAAEPEPNCQEEPLALYYIERCCGQDEFGYALRKFVLSGSTNYSGTFEFNSVGRTNDSQNCTRHIPVSSSTTTLTSTYCSGETPSPSVQVLAIYECSKRITNCATGAPEFGSACLDFSQITVQFFANQGGNYTYRDPECTTTQGCFSAFLTGTAIYRRAKSASDTHVAVGAYTLVWSSTPYDDNCYLTGPKQGCPGNSPFPQTITVGIKP